MKIFKDKLNLQKELSKGNRVCFIPTMGGLHKGHEYLIKRAKKLNKKTLVSIFINPKQFNDKKDFLKYPRNFIRDLSLLRKLKVNYVFMPNYKDIFRFKTKNKIFLDKFSNKLCGKTRKNHFKGVLNVVNRLIEIIKPRYLFLGKKDFQQLYLIKKHLFKNKIDTTIIECKTIRENNGVACSTRNNHLGIKDIKIASQVYYYLKNIKKKFPIKIFDIKKNLYKFGINKIDYLEFINVKTLKKPKLKSERYKIFIAYYLKKTRLIDNI